MLKKFIDEGAIYKDYDDQPVEPLTFFKQQGWNAQRVRLFVDPANATDTEKKEGAIQDLAYVKALGKSIKDAGFSLMLDFHSIPGEDDGLRIGFLTTDFFTMEI